MDNVKNAWKGIKYFIAVENQSLDIPELSVSGFII